MDERNLIFGLWLFGLSGLLISCSPADVAKSFLRGKGGPNVAANGQIGAENNQTVGSVSNIDAGSVEQLVVNNVSVAMIIALVVAVVIGMIGWFLPTPRTMMKKWKDR